mmetsp:Transcript_25955/g.74280  ORF Transcript_25955/g.74280 Transcript_25955/m.74280 type:complete len:327 (+) Transcript_25955:73-1053(+)
MPRQRVKSTPRDAAAAGTQVHSDEEILKERRRIERFERADDILRLMSWGLTVLAAGWFLLFFPVAPTVTSLGGPLGEAGGDAIFGLYGCGLFCGNLSRSGPRGTWSAWRKVWHLVWAPCFVLAALAFARFGLLDTRVRSEMRTPLPPSSYGVVVAVACGVLGFAMLLACPRGNPNAARPSQVVWGRVLLAGDGVVGLTLSLARLRSGMAVSFSEPLGLSTLWVSTVPLAMWSLGTVLCRSDGELIAAVPAALVHYLLVMCHLVYSDGVQSALAMLLMALLHAALYLPLPWHDPDSNPFHVCLRKHLRSFTMLLTGPVSGWGDDGGG